MSDDDLKTISSEELLQNSDELHEYVKTLRQKLKLLQQECKILREKNAAGLDLINEISTEMKKITGK